MKLHPRGLTPSQIEAARLVSGLVTAREGYLAGGAAVSLYLGHRRSVDLDYFFASIADPEEVARSIEALGARVNEVDRGTVHATLSGVPLSFLEFKHPTVAPAVSWPQGGCKLASVADLATMKLNAVASRGYRKDFYDVFALGEGPISLAEMLSAYRRRFPASDLGHVLQGLTYFPDADSQADPELLEDMPWEEVKATLRSWVREYTARA